VTQEDVPVYRTQPLPRGNLSGHFLSPAVLIDDTRDALVGFALAGLDDCGHEGIAFWAGLQDRELTAFSTVIVPEAEHSHGRVLVTEAAYGKAVRAAKSVGLALLAQVHSHPGTDTRHSDGDDTLVILPYEGMLSVVVPRFGIGWTDLGSAAIHQFQLGRWVLCSPESVRQRFRVSEAVLDARG